MADTAQKAPESGAHPLPAPKPRMLGGLAFFFAAISSACCWTAWLLGALGLLASGTTHVTFFEPFRPIGLVLMVLLLGGSLWASYRKIGSIDPVLWGVIAASLIVAFLHH